MLYAPELTWNGRKGIEGAYQNAINRMSKTTLGSFRSTPLGIVRAESRVTPARALLNYHWSNLAKRLYARLRDRNGSEEILERDRSALATRLRAAAAFHRTETAEPQVWGTGRMFPGQIIVNSREGAIIAASRHGQVGAV